MWVGPSNPPPCTAACRMLLRGHVEPRCPDRHRRGGLPRRVRRRHLSRDAGEAPRALHRCTWWRRRHRGKRGGRCREHRQRYCRGCGLVVPRHVLLRQPSGPDTGAWGHHLLLHDGACVALGRPHHQQLRVPRRGVVYGGGRRYEQQGLRSERPRPAPRGAPAERRRRPQVGGLCAARRAQAIPLVRGPPPVPLLQCCNLIPHTQVSVTLFLYDIDTPAHSPARPPRPNSSGTAWGAT